MALLEKKVNCSEGPSRWDMLLTSLLEGKDVRFKIGPQRIVFRDHSPSEWIRVRIIQVARAEQKGMPHVEDVWSIKGEMCDPYGSMMAQVTVDGWYNTTTRSGEFILKEREYRNGADLWYGWKDKGDMKNPVRPADAINFQ